MRRHRLIVAVSLVLGLVPFAFGGQTAAQSLGNAAARPAPPGMTARPLDAPRLAQAPEPYCFCWSDGRKIAEGAMACIRTTQGRRLALCGRVINMMSWEVSENPCPES